MATPDDLDRTVELPPEPLDDIDPLQSTDSAPLPRPRRTQTVSLPPPLEESSWDGNLASQDPDLVRELASRRLTIARREQRHRHTVELVEQRHRHEQRLLRRRLEGRIVAAVVVLVVVSGLWWISVPAAEAAQIVFTTSFGAVAGYLGARSRRENEAPAR